MVGDRCWILLARTYNSSIVTLHASYLQILFLCQKCVNAPFAGLPAPWAVSG
jgi:hypothetical protein